MTYSFKAKKALKAAQERTNSYNTNSYNKLKAQASELELRNYMVKQKTIKQLTSKPTVKHIWESFVHWRWGVVPNQRRDEIDGESFGDQKPVKCPRKFQKDNQFSCARENWILRDYVTKLIAHVLTLKNQLITEVPTRLLIMRDKFHVTLMVK